MTSVVMAVQGEVTMRAAHTLATQPGISAVNLLAPSTSSQFDTVESVEGHDVVVGMERAAQLGAHNGIPAVVSQPDSNAPGVRGASPAGLALALAVGLDGVTTTAVARPGESAGNDTLVFPSPIDARPVTVERFDGQSLHVARGPGPLTAAMATGTNRHRVIIDDHRFLSGIALAAGVMLVEDDMTDVLPVWARSDHYLKTAVDMGLVIGERSPG